MPRLFTGLEVPYAVGLALSLKRGGLYGARWMDPENYHITLRFIGDVDHTTANEVTDALDRLAHSEAFSIRLNHLGVFGGDKPRALYAGSPRRLKSEVHVALVDVASPEHVFARLGFGDWNACPAPQVHVAWHARWRALCGAEPIAVCGDTVECTVARPPTTQAVARALAKEQNAYCPDLVEQGAGSIGKLASSLLEAPAWTFWWD